MEVYALCKICHVKLPNNDEEVKAHVEWHRQLLQWIAKLDVYHQLREELEPLWEALPPRSTK